MAILRCEIHIDSLFHVSCFPVPISLKPHQLSQLPAALPSPRTSPLPTAHLGGVARPALSRAAKWLPSSPGVSEVFNSTSRCSPQRSVNSCSTASWSEPASQLVLRNTVWLLSEKFTKGKKASTKPWLWRSWHSGRSQHHRSAVRVPTLAKKLYCN